jgi:hypothetical protein
VFYSGALALKTERGTYPHYGAGLWPFDRVASPPAWPNCIEAANGVASKQKGKTMSKTKTTNAGPAYRIYSVTKEGEKATWFEIGAAWKHKDGKGYGLQFKALPLPGAEIVLREPKPVGGDEE